MSKPETVPWSNRLRTLLKTEIHFSGKGYPFLQPDDQHPSVIKLTEQDGEHCIYPSNAVNKTGLSTNDTNVGVM